MKKAISVLCAALLLLAMSACSLFPFPADGPDEPGSVPASSEAQPSGVPASQPDPSSESSEEASSEAPQSRPEESSGQSEQQPSSHEPESRPESLDWVGLYLYGSETDGELLIVQEVSGGYVRGTYVYEDAIGEFGARDFAFEQDPHDPNVASELFQNGTDYIYYRLSEDRITVDYPAGWWEDREYLYFCSLERRDQFPHHPFLAEESEPSPGQDSSDPSSGHEPFYGIWTAASGDFDEAQGYADDLRESGFDAKVYVTTDWSNLNSVRWYVVSAGEYASEQDAETALAKVHAAGWTDAYIKHTGDWQG